MNTIKFDNRGSLMIAHRGASGIETENTCSAFVAAGNRSYFGIETDVHTTADGKFIIVHDDCLKRISGDELTVESCTYDTLRKLRLFNTDGKKSRGDLMLPDLDEYISICAKYKKYAVLELKNPMSLSNIGRITGIINNLGYTEATIIISFCFDNLLKLRSVPGNEDFYGVQLLGSADDIKKHYVDMKKHRIDADVFYKTLDERLINQMHGDGMKINCWTVDSPADAERLSALGVDYITSNILE